MIYVKRLGNQMYKDLLVLSQIIQNSKRRSTVLHAIGDLLTSVGNYIKDYIDCMLHVIL